MTRAKKEKLAAENLQNLKNQLQWVRRASLLATRRNDFMQIARLTAQASVINKAIIEAEGLVVVDENSTDHSGDHF